MNYIPLRLLRIIYACLLDLLRRSVYFLNIVIFACFIVLIEIGHYKLVSKSWSVLSGLVFVEFPVVCDMYGSTVGTCCVVLFF
jgi:hypothetical protein